MLNEFSKCIQQGDIAFTHKSQQQHSINPMSHLRQKCKLKFYSSMNSKPEYLTGHQPCSLDTSPALNIIKPKTNTATNIQSPEPALALAPSLEPAPTLAFKGQNQHQHPESSQELAPAPYAKPKHCYPALSPETSFKSQKQHRHIYIQSPKIASTHILSKPNTDLATAFKSRTREALAKILYGSCIELPNKIDSLVYSFLAIIILKISLFRLFDKKLVKRGNCFLYLKNLVLFNMKK